MSKHDSGRWRRWAPLVLLALLIASVLFPGRVRAQTIDGPSLDPSVGDYTVGLYADRAGSTELLLEKDDTTFDVFIGLTGDPVRNFSASAFKLELPDFLEPAGPILWQPIEGLKEREEFFGRGGQVVFSVCDVQPDDGPLILGRLPVAADPRFREATLEPLPHRQYGLSVQLCQQQGVWPKRDAEPVALHVKRHVSFWDRVTSWFD